MVKDKNLALGSGYVEEFDFARLQDIRDMSMRDAAKTIIGRVVRVHGDDCPDGSYSDFECNVWSMMNGLVMFGMELERFKNKVDAIGDDRIELIDAFEDFNFMSPIMHDVRLMD